MTRPFGARANGSIEDFHAMWFYVIKSGQKQGPFSVEELRARVADGSFKRTDVAWQEGWSRHLPLAAVLSGHPVPPPGGTPVPDAEGNPGTEIKIASPRSILKAINPLNGLSWESLCSLPGIRWGLLLGAIPLFFSYISGTTGALESFLLDTYMAVIVALSLFLLVRPDSCQPQKVAVFTVVPFLLVMGNNGLTNLLHVENSFWGFLLVLFKLGLTYTLVSLPFFFLYIRKRHSDSLRTIVF